MVRTFPNATTDVSNRKRKLGSSVVAGNIDGDSRQPTSVDVCKRIKRQNPDIDYTSKTQPPIQLLTNLRQTDRWTDYLTDRQTGKQTYNVNNSVSLCLGGG
ncbi:hypothetical protein DPMN_087584 [Dreissena polymorpha]|uniref:Uncharacterized protein n=1 Tax=Dreissena polymorpha TaxID=45954 RepID=A0A9D4KUI7_DREPO|nr:hypothetical protein DPMN_087584 [Dreissena polymorpha]